MMSTVSSFVSRTQRGQVLSGGIQCFRGCTIWFTGLSGAGKSTLAFNIEDYLCNYGIAAYAVDGDDIRRGLNNNLGFSAQDRSENIRRIAETSKLFANLGLIVLTSCISPFSSSRKLAKDIHEKDNLPFFECYVATPLEVCEKRDVKGLYKKARDGQIKEFTGINQPYESPKNPDLVINAHESSIDQCVLQVISLLKSKGILPDNFDEEIKELFIPIDEQDRERQIADNLISVEVSKIDLQWIQVLSEGWATPLKGFMRESQYLQCLHFGTVKNQKSGRVDNQTIPIVLAISDQDKDRVQHSKDIALKYNSKVIAILCSIEIFDHRKEERCARTFGTTDIGHPTINIIMHSGNWLVGGDLKVFDRIKWNDDLDRFRLTPIEIRNRFKEMKADTVFAFQLRNPIHNGHALLMQETRKQLLNSGYKNPVLLLHPLGGWTKDDDVPLPVRIAQHQAVLEEGVLDHNTTLLAIFPSPMSYAGPKEVQWHAKARIVTGIKYYIVGRDPAGIPHPVNGTDLYDPDHGKKVLQMAPGLSKLNILPFRVAAYNKQQGRMTFFDGDNKEDFEFISGTKMRSIARSDGHLPKGFMADKAWQVLVDFYKKN